jgi:hypothetical protein
VCFQAFDARFANMQASEEQSGAGREDRQGRWC